MRRVMIEYPFPLEGDTDDSQDPLPWIAHVRVPKDLRRHEAERLKAFIDSLVIRPEERRAT